MNKVEIQFKNIMMQIFRCISLNTAGIEGYNNGNFPILNPMHFYKKLFF